MIEAVLNLSEEYDMLPSGALVLCAVSGGADSMCLLHLLHTLAPSMGFSLAAAHYHHGLRGRDADADAAFVADFCRDHQIRFFIGRGDAASAAASSGRGIEATARALRYAFLEETARELGANRIATAHTADDNLETILLSLTRGTGLSGLGGIPPRRGNIVRPLLTTARRQIMDYLLAHELSHREDQSNLDLRFTRNRIRHQVVPVLRALNPNLEETSVRMISSLRADNDFLNAQALRIVSKAESAWGGLLLGASYLSSQPPALGARAVRLLLGRMTAEGRRDLGAAHITAVLALARGGDPSAETDLPGGIQVRRVYASLLFTVGSPVAPAIEPVPVSLDGETVLPEAGWQIIFRPTEEEDMLFPAKDTFFIRRDGIRGAPVVRSRRTGDRISLPSRGGRSLKRLFIDAKIPSFLRENIPVLADETGVIAVAGFGPDETYAAPPGEKALALSFCPLPGRGIKLFP